MREVAQSDADEDQQRHHGDRDVVVGPRIDAEAPAEQPRRGDAVEAGGAVGQIRPVAHHDRHDLAEAQRDDGEVVAAQPQRRRAEQDAEERRQARRKRQAEPERQGEVHHAAAAGLGRHLGDQAEIVERLPERAPLGLQLEGGQDAVGIGTDGEERGIAQVEQAGEADHDVQPERQRGIGRGVGHAVHVGVVVVQQRERQRGGGQQDQADAPALHLGNARERSRQDRDSGGSGGVHAERPLMTCWARPARTDRPA